MQRIRIRYQKNALLRYTSTQDNQKMWERILRRAKLPMVYSQGFHPQPKIQLGCPLPLGMTSQAEFVDFWLENASAPADLAQQIAQVIHPGMEIQEVKEISSTDPSLQSLVESASYLVTLRETSQGVGLPEKIASLLAMEKIIQEKRGKTYDLRPLIQECSLINEAETQAPQIFMKLSALPGATGRPEEVLKALGIDASDAVIERLEIQFSMTK